MSGFRMYRVRHSRDSVVTRAGSCKQVFVGRTVHTVVTQEVIKHISMLKRVLSAHNVTSMRLPSHTAAREWEFEGAP